MNRRRMQHLPLCLAVCLMSALLAAPAVGQDQQVTSTGPDLQGGTIDGVQVGGLQTVNLQGFITSTCIYGNCTLTITNGSTNPVMRTLYDSGGGNFTLQCQNNAGGAVGKTILLIPGHLLSGMACPATARTMNLVCGAPPCPYAYVP